MTPPPPRLRRASRLLAAVAIAIGTVGLPAVPTAQSTRSAPALDLVQRDVHLMGTRARLAVFATGQDQGFAILEKVLTLLERTERELSTWIEDSDISRLNRTPLGEVWKANRGLCALFADLYEWHHATAGAFDPGVGALAGAWRIHENGRVPSDAEIEEVRARSGLERIEFHRADCTLRRGAEVTIDVGAFGKGDALDRVARELPGVPWIVDLGGHVSVGAPQPGQRAWTIDVAHPLIRDRAALQVSISAGSLSTSGSSERDNSVNGVRVGHIIDPRSGRPALFQGSVVVWHERALVADILSTALYVMGPDGLRWAEERGFAVCYLIPDKNDIKRVMTPAFARLIQVETPAE